MAEDLPRIGKMERLDQCLISSWTAMLAEGVKEAQRQLAEAEAIVSRAVIAASVADDISPPCTECHQHAGTVRWGGFWFCAACWADET